MRISSPKIRAFANAIGKLTPVSSRTSSSEYCRKSRRKKLASSRNDRKSTRLNSSHSQISYAVFCLKKKKQHSRHGLADHHPHTHKQTITLQSLARTDLPTAVRHRDARLNVLLTLTSVYCPTRVRTC